MNKEVSSTQRMNSVISKNDDLRREIMADSWSSENLAYDIALLKSIEAIETAEERMANSRKITAQYKGSISAILEGHTSLILGTVHLYRNIV